ncbi:MAG: TlpA disulfide reductase family protein [Desulfobulbaceae bacterium]|jgi:peroxiredoxin|nr:TlpA disulfide reductase family protein [Desulfobulbaceae bacterium]
MRDFAGAAGEVPGRRRPPIFVLLMIIVLLAACGQEKQPPVQIGDSAPQFTLRDLDGNPVSLSDYRGAPVVLRFILIDCKFCRADTPAFKQMYAKYGGQGLGMLYIESMGADPAVLEAFADSLALTFPTLRDPGGDVAARYKVRALPQTIVLSPEHTIVAAILGGVSEQELQALLEPYFD